MVNIDCQRGDREVSGSHLLLAVGRRPNTHDMGLDKTGIEADKRGYIVVDDQLRTKAPGDCNGKGAFTHTAYNDFEIVAANLLDNDPRRVSNRILCYGLYIDPPLGVYEILVDAESKEILGAAILVDGGEPLKITSFSGARSSATWAPDNTIIFPDGGVLKRIPESGGEPDQRIRYL